MKKLLYQKRYLILGLLAVIVLISLTSWYFSSSSPANKSFSKKEPTWQTVEVKVAQDFASIKLPAKVKSNQFAIISPRRTGIIQDLIVDIGDEVTKGQTIGSMLPEGVEGQSSAAIAQASSQLQKTRAELGQAKGVAVDAVSVASQQWRETTLQTQTQVNLETETQKQLAAKKAEAQLVATQAWENIKLVLFNTGGSQSNRQVVGTFANAILSTNVENLADDIEQMEASGVWNTPETVIQHLSHLQNFITQVEALYKTAKEGRNLSRTQISANLNTIQTQQLKISQITQSILALEEKSKNFVSIQAEKEAGTDRSKEVLELVQSQQNLSLTQAEENVAVALANYNSALVKAGHQSITSPFSGVITARMAEVGQNVTPSNPLFYLEGATTARSQESLHEIHFNLPESWHNQLKVGDAIEIKTLDTNQKLSGEIFRLSQQVDLNTQSIKTTAIVDPPPEKGELEGVLLAHGQSVFVYLTKQDTSLFSVPSLALKKRGTQYFIWKMTDKPSRPIPVEVVAEDGEFSQIFSTQITTEDQIISNPSVSLFSKQ